MKLTKKEKQLYFNHGKKWDVIVKHYITLCNHDTDNLLKVHGKVVDAGLVILKRETKRLRLPFNWYIYFNRVFGGVDE